MLSDLQWLQDNGATYRAGYGWSVVLGSAPLTGRRKTGLDRRRRRCGHVVMPAAPVTVDA